MHKPIEEVEFEIPFIVSREEGFRVRDYATQRIIPTPVNIGRESLEGKIREMGGEVINDENMTYRYYEAQGNLSDIRRTEIGGSYALIGALGGKIDYSCESSEKIDWLLDMLGYRLKEGEKNSFEDLEEERRLKKLRVGVSGSDFTLSVKRKKTVYLESGLKVTLDTSIPIDDFKFGTMENLGLKQIRSKKKENRIKYLINSGGVEFIVQIHDQVGLSPQDVMTLGEIELKDPNYNTFRTTTGESNDFEGEYFKKGNLLIPKSYVQTIKDSMGEVLDNLGIPVSNILRVSNSTLFLPRNYRDSQKKIENAIAARRTYNEFLRQQY